MFLELSSTYIWWIRVALGTDASAILMEQAWPVHSTRPAHFQGKYDVGLSHFSLTIILMNGNTLKT